MAKRTLTVNCEFGTFTRQTERAYSHVVIVRALRAEVRERERLETIAYEKSQAARYRATLERGSNPEDRSEWSRQFTARKIEDGSYSKWIASSDATVAKLESIGPITEDADGPLDALKPPVAGALGWCGRLDLARKLAASPQATRYRTVAIVDVATGEIVR